MLRPARQWLRYVKFRLTNTSTAQFVCPVCSYEGAFEDAIDSSGTRKSAQCPRCGALERHRIQFLTLKNVLARLEPQKLRFLHFAPEPFFVKRFRAMVGRYETADIAMDGVDHKVDLLSLPFEDASYDFVYASHVLEHILDDLAAIKEIRRVLRPGGMAILPVPLVGEKTIEYGVADHKDFGHVRAPGYDYYQRFLPYFSRVEEYGSEVFPQQYQVFIYEDRSVWPSPDCPRRMPTLGEKHRDVVPVCFV
jgi:SAM-dependent methyltransferase